MKKKLIISRTLWLIIVMVMLAGNQLTIAQELYTPKGVRIIENKSFDNSPETRQKIIKAYENLRVTDVIDALDLIGLQDIHSFHKNIRPLWRDVESQSHAITGFAYTVRFVPTDVRVGQNSFSSTEEAKQWKNKQYGRTPSWDKLVQEDDVLVIDANDIGNVGFIGSNNALDWALVGVRGVITNGHARDTDELIREKPLPVYCTDGYSAQGIRPGRLIAESYNFPVTCAGVLVFPGDLIIADGDGVISVPRELALKVAELAKEVSGGDQRDREIKKAKLFH